MSENLDDLAARLRRLIKKEKNDETKEIISKVGIERHVYDIGTPLSVACIFNNTEIASYCVKNGANVNVTDSSSYTPLMTCCKHGNLDMIRLLLENGAEINAQNKYDATPLSLAIADHPENLELIEYLLQNGADSMIYEKYGESDPRITTYTAYDFAKYDLEDKELIILLDKYKK
jgi:ankyrin repeat protein